MNREKVKSSLLLFTAAFIWGVAFVAQSVGLEYVGPMTFNGSRFLLGGTVLLPLILIGKKRQSKESGKGRVTLVGGFCCGLAICIASVFQQYGIQYTTVGKAGFITALYIVIVPLFGIFLKKKVSPLVWVGASLALAGFYLLCITESLQINQGDMLVFLCAVFFSFHILIIDHFAPKTDPIQLSCIQFYVSGVICTVAAFFLEKPSLGGIIAGGIPILYAGVLSCGVAYTLQVVGQAKMKPTVASMILSLESVISVLAGWIILKEVLTIRQLTGCILVFGAVILAQLPWPLKKQRKKHKYPLLGHSR